MPVDILVATKNRNKLAEIQAILGPGVNLHSLDEFPGFRPSPENGLTFHENACLKAVEASAMARVPALADDSGLSVDYLNGAPGVISARYSDPGATSQTNNKKLLEQLAGVPPQKRGAHFTCVIAYADGLNPPWTVEGICRGHIGQVPAGEGGFGYDPLFIPEGYQETFAQIPAEIKNRISHRGKALAAFRERFFSGGQK